MTQTHTQREMEGGREGERERERDSEGGTGSNREGERGKVGERKHTVLIIRSERTVVLVLWWVGLWVER